MLSICAVLQKIEEAPGYLSQEDEERECKGCKAGEFVCFFVANYCQLAQTLFARHVCFHPILGIKMQTFYGRFLKVVGLHLLQALYIKRGSKK